MGWMRWYSAFSALCFAGILINEVLTHTDLPQVDTIELHNPEGAMADMGGWFLTDDFYTPKKFRIPDGTILGSDGYVVYDEYDFFYPDTNSFTSFQLSSTGDDVWLFSADTQSNLTGHAHGFLHACCFDLRCTENL